ncbi:MAG: hypothetical protein ACNI3C_10485 [Candidatus Marinarcus sp.]|uniref:hypothetical protein n=1 Tax=Candidatus Marinarcus sp. TaxID=3100987 RepID=UPI003B00D208
MQINNAMSSLNAMVAAQVQVDQSAQMIAQVSNAVASPETQGASQELIDAITSQLTATITYEANGNAIKTQNEISDILLNIKA